MNKKTWTVTGLLLSGAYVLGALTDPFGADAAAGGRNRDYPPELAVGTASSFRAVALPDGGVAVEVEGCGTAHEADGGPPVSGCHTFQPKKPAHRTQAANCLELGLRVFVAGERLSPDAGL